MLARPRVLLAGVDEPSVTTLRQMLESAGHEVWHAPSVADAARRIGAGDVDVVVISRDAVTSADRLVEAQCAMAPASFILLGHARTTEPPSDALRACAWDVVKPTEDAQAVLIAVERAAREVRLQRELAMLRARVGDAAREALIGRSPAIARVRELVGRAAASRAPVLVLGEAGTGKTLVARLVHDLSERAARPLVIVRCAGADPQALHDELFGRVGADDAGARAGVLESARGGTVVLEDVPALPATWRAEIARASATHRVQRKGAIDTIPIDVRLVLTASVSATESDAAPFEDLISRFNALVVEVPPLREHRSDIPQLAQTFRERLAKDRGLPVEPLPPNVMLSLLGREWPGNVRELEEWVERSAPSVPAVHPGASLDDVPGVDLSASQATLEQLERAYILHVLALESGHQSRTAARLGIDRRTLYRKLKQYRREH